MLCYIMLCYVMLYFSGGNFGELRVYYSTEVLTAAVDPGNVANVFDYFSQPQQGSRGIMGERVDVPAGSDPTAVKNDSYVCITKTCQCII